MKKTILILLTVSIFIISCGKDNSYGHPHQEVLDILNKFDVKILRTDEAGLIKINSDGENITVVD